MELRPYRREGLVLALLAAVALSPVNPPGDQFISRVGLTQALVERGELSIDPVANETIDRARYRGRSYTDKAPGMSLAAVPPYAALAAAGSDADRLWFGEGGLGSWFVRVAANGPFFLLAAFLLGRAAEGLAAGTGAAAAAFAGLGTLLAPLAPTVFGHVAAGALGLGALVLGRRGAAGRAALAGLLAGAAVLVEYQAALIVLVLGALVAARGVRLAAVFAAGTVPGLSALALYNLAAFGSPLRFSYELVDNEFAAEQAQGFFGIGPPRAESLAEVLAGPRGLLTTTPVVALAAAGLVLLWRRGLRAEAAACAAVGALFLALEAGYFLPLGGISPGARFFAPALPFLLLGLGPALARWPRVGLALGAFSVVATTVAALTWANSPADGVLLPRPGAVTLTLPVWLGLDRLASAALVSLVAGAAVVVAGIELLRRGRTEPA